MAQKQMAESKHLETVAKKVIHDEALSSLDNIRIRYLIVSPEISKKKLAQCIKANKEVEFFGECDFIIEVGEKIWNALDEQRQYLLMFHELLHIKVAENKKGELVLGIQDHDIKDFREIISKYGIDWIEELRTINSSLYDLEPGEQEDISI